MNTVIVILTWSAATAVLWRIFYVSGISWYTYYLTDRRLKGFPNYQRQNELFHAKLLTSESRVVPAPTPHALNSSCIYNIKQNTIRLKAIVPEGVYWSVTIFGRNQACYFTLNDMEAREKYGDEIEIVLTKSSTKYQPKGREIVVQAPKLSQIGLILIRTIVMDPTEKNRVEQVREIQQKAFVELVL